MTTTFNKTEDDDFVVTYRQEPHDGNGNMSREGKSTITVTCKHTGKVETEVMYGVTYGSDRRALVRKMKSKLRPPTTSLIHDICDHIRNYSEEDVRPLRIGGCGYGDDKNPSISFSTPDGSYVIRVRLWQNLPKRLYPAIQVFLGLIEGKIDLDCVAVGKQHVMIGEKIIGNTIRLPVKVYEKLVEEHTPKPLGKLREINH